MPHRSASDGAIPFCYDELLGRAVGDEERSNAGHLLSLGDAGVRSVSGTRDPAGRCAQRLTAFNNGVREGVAAT
jgi:hypothetical protein